MTTASAPVLMACVLSATVARRAGAKEPIERPPMLEPIFTESTTDIDGTSQARWSST